MQVSQRYRFIYRRPTQRVDHQSVLDYLGEDEGNYILNARPIAGTQTLPKSWVKRIEPAPGAKLCIGKMAPRET